MAPLHGLTTSWTMPKGVASLDVRVRWLKAEYCAVAIDYLDRDRNALKTYAIRCGSHIWHELVMPALRQYGAINRLPCTIREVQPVGPAPLHPSRPD